MKRPHQNDPPEVYNAKKLAALLAKVKPVESGCHEWQGFVSWNGYGFTSYRGRNASVHRLIYILTHGPVPRKMDICHSCDNRKCCNLNHLWLGTRQQNLIDASNKGRIHCQKKTHCPKGHSYAEHGRQHYTIPTWRICTACIKDKMRRELENGVAGARQRRYRARIRAERLQSNS